CTSAPPATSSTAWPRRCRASATCAPRSHSKSSNACAAPTAARRLLVPEVSRDPSRRRVSSERGAHAVAGSHARRERAALHARARLRLVRAHGARPLRELPGGVALRPGAAAPVRVGGLRLRPLGGRLRRRGALRRAPRRGARLLGGPARPLLPRRR